MPSPGRLHQIDTASRRERDVSPRVIQADKSVVHTQSQNSVTMAKTQQAPTSNGKLSVKEWNGTAEVGDAFDVWTNYAKSTSFNMANYYPQIPSGTVWPIEYLNGEWYLDWTPVPVESVTVMVDWQISGTTFQKRQRTSVKVIDDGTLGSWATAHTGTVCSQ